jgi:hypothetical protein
MCCGSQKQGDNLPGRSAAAMLLQVGFWNIPVKDYLFPITFIQTMKI